MGAKEWAALLLLSIVWGGSFFFNKIALAQVPPFTVVLVRCGLAAVILYLLVRASGQRMPASRSVWQRFFLMAAFNSLIPFSLILWGQTQIASGLASILNATTPVWAVLLAHFTVRGERLTPNRMVGVFCGIVGITFLIGWDALQGISLNMLAQLAVLGAAFCYAASGIYGGRFLETPPLITATGQVICTALMMAPIALLLDRPWLLPVPGAQALGALLTLALVSTAFAYVLYFRLLETAGATNLTLVTFLIPVSALFLGIVFLHEQIHPRTFFGMALITAGLAAIDGRLFLRRERPA
jgi:drug/metabolite transporter (DMT)-like permease